MDERAQIQELGFADVPRFAAMLSRLRLAPSGSSALGAEDAAVLSGRAQARLRRDPPHARGVSNFVCTAWPAQDGDARTFARVFYARLLGLEPGTTRGEAPDGPQTVQCAPASDARTWGAYQHYGDPSFRPLRPWVRQPMTGTPGRSCSW